MIRKISARKRRANREWARARELMLSACHHVCEFGLSPDCTGVATEPHHVLPLSQGGNNETSNCEVMCPACHQWIHANPKKAMEMGLLKSNPAKIAASPLMEGVIK